MSEISLEEIALEARGGLGFGGGRASRLRISSFCPSIRDVLIRHMAVVVSCGVIEVSFGLFMVSCEESL